MENLFFDTRYLKRNYLSSYFIPIHNYFFMKLFTRFISLLLFFSFATFYVSGQTAGFTADITSGCAPLIVHFSNTTGCATCSYTWNLDNGSGPIHLTDCAGTYSTPGTYTVTLTSTDSSSGITTMDSLVITVVPSPVVTFTASDTAICPGTSVTFTSTVVPGVPGAVSYLWNFGDGYTGTGASPSHTYNTPGHYSVSVSVTNSAGCSTLFTISDYIHVFTPATPAFSAATGFFCSAPGHAVFTNSTTGTGPFTYHWSFGDGSTSTIAAPTHNYAAGTYSVTLTVTDGRGCTDSLTIPAGISVSSLIPAFTVPTTGFCKYSTVTFPNTSTTHLSSSWNFGDGGTATTDTGMHTYDTTGTFTVTLVVYDGHCYDTVSHTVTIHPGVIGYITQWPEYPCPPPVGVTFTDSLAPAGTIVTWLYGDGTSGTGVTAAHTFWHRAVDTISMISLDPATGCKDTIKRIDTLYDLNLNPSLLPLGGCIPQTDTFGFSDFTLEPDSLGVPPSYPFGISSYTWHFGDGTTSTGPSAIPYDGAAHTYTAVGTYTVIFTGITTNGCIVNDTAVNVYMGSTPGIVTFTATPTTACYNHNLIYFTVDTAGYVVPGTTYRWFFGDGEVDIDSSLSATHNYERPGIFTVTLTPIYNYCPGIPYILTDYITIDSPKAIIHYKVLCFPHNTVAFADSSAGDNARVWSFGDGSTSTVANPMHTYSSPGVYSIYLYAYNSISGCRDTALATLDLSSASADFAASDTAICKGSTISFSPIISGLAGAYTWYMDGTLLNHDISFSETFPTAGIFSITLIIADQFGCLDTLTKPGYIHVGQPIDSFTASPTAGCWPLVVTFTDHSTDIAGASLTYAWLYGDGTTSTVTTPVSTHTFTITGAAIAKEIVTDNIGCTDSFSVPLTVYRPIAIFTDSNTHPCLDNSTHFINTSTGFTTSYWTFGDGLTSPLTSPSHSYSALGTYTVTLKVSDTHGCWDTATLFLDVTKPTASFSMDDSAAICPPLTVHFTGTSTGASTYRWTFGDGGTSVLASPTYLYVADGYDTITLVVTNIYGCTDTATAHVNIFGYAGAFSNSVDSGCVPLYVHFVAGIGHVSSIIWDFDDGITSTPSSLDTISHIYLTPGAYLPKLILSNGAGCESLSRGIDTIKVDGVTPGFTTKPNPACLGATFNLADTSKSYWSTITAWNWTFDGSTSNISAPTFVINTVGTYPAVLVVTDGWGCTAHVSENITVYPLPVITVNKDTIICVGDSALLTGYGGVTYTWSPAAAFSCDSCNPAFSAPTVVTQYTVTGTDAQGCSSTDTTSVFLKTNTVSIASGDTQICAGNTIPLSDSGGTKYTWIPAKWLNNPYIADPLATPDSTIKYMAIAQLSSCIPDTNYVTVIVHPLPTVYAGPDQALVAGALAQLSATGTLIYTYAWDNGNTLSCDTCANPVASMSVTTTYNVQVASYFGCTSSDTVTIHVYCDNSQIFIPNSFTPNGDGQDDVFYPRGRGVRIIKSFRIYNRWGQMIFERSNIELNDVSNAWDGSYNGNTPKPDVYVYILDALCETGEPLNLKGDVTIIR